MRCLDTTPHMEMFSDMLGGTETTHKDSFRRNVDGLFSRRTSIIYEELVPTGEKHKPIDKNVLWVVQKLKSTELPTSTNTNLELVG